jgi:hypothetical protein
MYWTRISHNLERDRIRTRDLAVQPGARLFNLASLATNVTRKCGGEELGCNQTTSRQIWSGETVSLNQQNFSTGDYLPRNNWGNRFLLMLDGDVGGGGGCHGPRVPWRGVWGEHELRRHPVGQRRKAQVSLNINIIIKISSWLSTAPQVIIICRYRTYCYEPEVGRKMYCILYFEYQGREKHFIMRTEAMLWIQPYFDLIRTNLWK